MRARPTLFLGSVALAAALVTTSTTSCGDDGPPEPVTITLLVQSSNIDFPAPPRPWSPAHTLPHTQAIDVAVRDAAPQLEPVVDARVALERSDGTHLGEAASDAAGLVVFEVPGDLWPDGATVSATAYKAGYTMHSLAGIARPTSADALPINLLPRFSQPPAMVRVEGLADNAPASRTLYVTSTAECAVWSQGSPSDYRVETPAGEPFDLVAIAYSFHFMSTQNYAGRWDGLARVSSDGLDADTVVTIDFDADAVTSTEFEGSFGLPARADSRLRLATSFPHLVLATSDSYWSGVIGFGTSIQRHGDAIDFVGEVVESPDYGTWYLYRIQTFDRAQFRERGPMSVAFGRGLPSDQQPALLDLPEWVGRPHADEPHSIDEPLSWEVFDEQVSAAVWITTGDLWSSTNDKVRWVVEVPDGVTEVRLPTPPSTFDIDLELGPAPSAVLAVQRPIDSDDGVFWLQAWGDELRLTFVTTGGGE